MYVTFCAFKSYFNTKISSATETSRQVNVIFTVSAASLMEKKRFGRTSFRYISPICDLLVKYKSLKIYLKIKKTIKEQL